LISLSIATAGAIPTLRVSASFQENTGKACGVVFGHSLHNE
jgi:hypothetical protein